MAVQCPPAQPSLVDGLGPTNGLPPQARERPRFARQVTRTCRRDPAAATELPFEFSLTGGERGIILEALDALNAIGVQDEEFPSAIRAFACFTADEPTVALEEPDYLQSLLIRSVARLPVRPTYPAEPSSNAPPRT